MQFLGKAPEERWQETRDALAGMLISLLPVSGDMVHSLGLHFSSLRERMWATGSHPGQLATSGSCARDLAWGLC